MLDVYLFYGENDNLKPQWCLGFNCSDAKDVTEKLNSYHRLVEADANPSDWMDTEKKKYKVIVLLGPTKDGLFKKKLEKSRDAIESIMSMKVNFISEND